MSQNKVCACTSKRRCDPCAERDFSLLLARCKADPKYLREEEEGKGIIIDPRPEAREGRSGFHRIGERGRKVVQERDDSPEEGEEEMKRISARVLKAKPATCDAQGRAVWMCSSCGVVSGDPLEGDDDKLHCPNVGCDAVVQRTTV